MTSLINYQDGDEFYEMDVSTGTFVLKRVPPFQPPSRASSTASSAPPQVSSQDTVDYLSMHAWQEPIEEWTFDAEADKKIERMMAEDRRRQRELVTSSDEDEEEQRKRRRRIEPSRQPA